MTKQGVTLFSSSADINNYTVLPQEFQEQYLYTYIFPNTKLHIDFGDNQNKTKLIPDMYRCTFKTQQVKLWEF